MILLSTRPFLNKNGLGFKRDTTLRKGLNQKKNTRPIYEYSQCKKYGNLDLMEKLTHLDPRKLYYQT